MPTGNETLLTGDALRKFIADEIAECISEDDLVSRALRGEPVDFGIPTINRVIERTGRRLAAIPDAVMPRMQEVRTQEAFAAVLREMIVEALSEVDDLMLALKMGL